MKSTPNTPPTIDEIVQHLRNMNEAATAFKRFAGKCRLDWLRINANPNKTEAQLGWIE